MIGYIRVNLLCFSKISHMQVYECSSTAHLHGVQGQSYNWLLSRTYQVMVRISIQANEAKTLVPAGPPSFLQHVQVLELRLVISIQSNHLFP